MKVLLHCCCAPCTIIPYRDLAKEHEVTLYWYNPNIHPVTEYLERRKALDDLLAVQPAELVDEGIYDFEDFIADISTSVQDRCAACYARRLFACVRAARDGGYDAFSTTLFYSPYQEQDAIKQIGQNLGNEFGVKLLYKDWRDQYRAGVEKSRELKLYRQKYCGCIYSEKERYEKKLARYLKCEAEHNE